MSRYRASFSFEGIVVRKTKLKETDLILTILSQEGSLLPLVAKGARKPHNSFAARMELGNRVRGLAFSGSHLAILKEVSLVRAFEGSRKDIGSLYALSTLCEGAYKLCTEGQEDKRYFFCLDAALLQLTNAQNEWASALLACAYLAKMFALLGLRPQLCSCISCAKPLVNAEFVCAPNSAPTADSSWKEASFTKLIDARFSFPEREFFSFDEGGLLCHTCAHDREDFLDLSSRLVRNFQLFDMLISLSFEECLRCAHAIQESRLNLGPLIDFIEQYSSYQGFGRIKSLTSFVHVLNDSYTC